MKIIGLVLLIAGVVLLIFGIIQFVEFRQSAAGKLSSIGNSLSKSLGGSSKVAKGYVQPIIMIIAGIAAGAAGYFVFKKN